MFLKAVRRTVEDAGKTVAEAGLKAGDVLTFHARPVAVAATIAAFAAIQGDGSAFSWGAFPGGRSCFNYRACRVREGVSCRP